ncbi:serine hydrolase [bacterium]|nr:serine hydrolase [bacterium]
MKNKEDFIDFELLDRALQTKYRYVNAILILKDGNNVFERYNGFEESYRFNIASVTKSFLSALIGVAIDKGFIKSVEEKVVDYFPEFKIDSNQLKKTTITIKDILNMVAPTASKSVGNRFEPLDRLRREKNWGEYIFKVLGEGDVGKFQYSSANAHLLSIILTKSTGLSAREFANRYLFEPIGAETIPDSSSSNSIDDVFGKNIIGWAKDPQNYTIGGWGLRISLRDMAKFGYLYLNKGVWSDKTIISEEWINSTITINSNSYSYLWWVKDLEESIFSFSAVGSGGNIICCVPDRDLVVAITSDVQSKVKNPWEIIERYIVSNINTR